MLRYLRIFLRLGGGLIAASLLLYLVFFAMVVVASREDQRRPADAIVVLGAAQYNGKPSPVLRARLDHALQLYRDSIAPRIVVTGGRGKGDTESEAEVSYRYLTEQSVSAEALVLRPEGRSTQASIAAVGGWLAEHDLRRIILVSDPFHMLRLRLETRGLPLEAYTSPTHTSPISESWRRELPFLAQEALKVPVALLRAW